MRVMGKQASRWMKQVWEVLAKTLHNTFWMFSNFTYQICTYFETPDYFIVTYSNTIFIFGGPFVIYIFYNYHWSGSEHIKTLCSNKTK